MELYNGNFYKILIKLTESPYSEVQYNCAGVIGHLAINGECSVHGLIDLYPWGGGKIGTKWRKYVQENMCFDVVLLYKICIRTCLFACKLCFQHIAYLL